VQSIEKTVYAYFNPNKTPNPFYEYRQFPLGLVYLDENQNWIFFLCVVLLVNIDDEFHIKSNKHQLHVIAHILLLTMVALRLK
jgi:hypothetical protein